jgi:hypothetical protein
MRIIHGPRPSFDPTQQHDGAGNAPPGKGSVRSSAPPQPDARLGGLQRPATAPGARGALHVSGRAPNLADVLVPAGMAPRTALRAPPAPYPQRPMSMPPYPREPSPNAYPGRPRAYSMPGPARAPLTMPDPADYKPGGRFGAAQNVDARPVHAYPEPRFARPHPGSVPASQASYPARPAHAPQPHPPAGVAPGPAGPTFATSPVDARIGSARQLFRTVRQALRAFTSEWTGAGDTGGTITASQSRREARLARYAEDSAPETPLTGGYGDGRFDRR